MALASCASSRFREANYEFVQSDECECARGYDLLGNTACGRRIVAVRDHVPSCQVGRFMREAGEVPNV